MADERGKRKRGRRRGRQEGRGPVQPGAEPQQIEQPGDLEITSEADVPGVTGSRFSFRRGGKEAGEDEERKRRDRGKAAEKAGSIAPGVKPMDFWRSGAARSYREQPLPRQGPARLFKRITGLYFPPWVPVVAIIFVVFGILGLLFFTRSATGAPHIGKDHWHATYQFIACGEKQANAPTWEAGVHTHGDGVIHIHPYTPSEEGSGARLVKWFEYGGGKLDKDEIRLPGSRTTYKNGDTCPDGTEGTVQVFVNGQKMDNYTRYLPKDGDRVRMVFGASEEVVTENDRTIIPEAQATRTVEITVTDDGTESGSRFETTSIDVTSGETVKMVIKNTGQISHGFRVQGDDGQFGTTDDYVSNPDVIKPGEQGVAVVRLDTAGTVAFRDETLNQVTGSIIVREGQPASPTPTPAPEGDIKTKLDVTIGDSFYEPAQLEVPAATKFKITLTNTGTFVYNMRIDGEDKTFDTEDDLVTAPDIIKPGETGELAGQIDKPGTYQLRDDFHPTLVTGTITVK